MPTPIDNTEWRKQWMHQKQFGHRLDNLRDLGLIVDDEQLRQFYLIDGAGFFPMLLEDPSLELEHGIHDANGKPIWVPWLFEFEHGRTSFYRDLDDIYTNWRDWPAFTGYMEPMGGCYDERCYSCGVSDWYTEELSVVVPVWEALIFLDWDVINAVRDHVREQLNNTNYQEWYHYWVDKQWGPDDPAIPRLSEPDDPLVMHPITMPTAELQRQWDAILEAAERNRRTCREIEAIEYEQRLEYDRRALARQERYDRTTNRKTG